jgi:hypothetical protein
MQQVSNQRFPPDIGVNDDANNGWHSRSIGDREFMDLYSVRYRPWSFGVAGFQNHAGRLC